jgi:polyhydroxyalkanoate synthase
MTDQALRAGPRPLAVHLATALAITTGSRIAWPVLSAGLPPWSGGPNQPSARSDPSALRREIAAVNAADFDAAVDAEARHRLDAFLRGIEAYRRHPARRDLHEPPTIWSEGATRLLDYGGAGAPVLVVPSLINRYTVLDLAPDASLVRFLADAGFRVLMVDWGAPGEAERNFTLSDYIAGRLDRALAAAPGRPAVIGYCMGGLLALALALRNPDKVAALALLATPWDFHADQGGPPPWLAALLPAVEATIAALGELPVDALQLMFASLDPTQNWVKFRRFARVDPDSAEAHAFVALEDWANDGVPLVGPVARECLVGWYMENAPARNAWRVAGAPVRPNAIECPALLALPQGDRIVPPKSAAALAAAIPGATILRPAAGHVGMVVGRHARSGLWEPLAAWLRPLLSSH